MLHITFYGVRGSTPTPSHANARYGGNTACVALEVEGEAPIVFDLGTGLRFFGEALGMGDQPFVGTALVTHLHWDHVQGLPFFMPINRPGARLDILGPPHEGCSMAASFDTFMRPPYFPIGVADLAGDVRFIDVAADCRRIGSATVMTRPVPHVGETNGYRVTWAGASVAYISDHQEPVGRPGDVADTVLELARDVDLLIHDAQYLPHEFEARSTWGHCTIDYAIEVARQAGARRLALFHHDPAHHDDLVDEILAAAVVEGERLGVEVIAAAEGMRLSLGGVVAR